MDFTPQIVLCTTLFVLVLSQFLKGCLTSLRKENFDIIAFFEQAEMPSTHTATATSLALGTYFATGFSMFFVLTIMVLIYVIEEVITIQRSVSKQSKIINGVLEFLRKANHQPKRHRHLFEKPMREQWGHKPLEVLAGFLIGVIVTFIIYLI